MALSPAQLQRLRKAAQKTYQAAGDSSEVLTRIGEEEGVPVITRLAGLGDAVAGTALTIGSVATILGSGGATALLGGGIGVVAGVSQAVEGIETLMGKVDNIQAGTTQIIESTGEGGSNECQLKAAERTQLSEIHGDLTNVSGGVTGTGAAARAASGLLGDFLLRLSSDDFGSSGGPSFPIKATAHELRQAAEGANTQSASASSSITDHRTDFAAFDAGLNARLALATSAIAPLLRVFLQSFGRYSLDLAGVAAYQADVTAGLISGNGLVVLWHDEVNEEWVPVLNPLLLTFSDPSGDEIYSTLEVAIDVLNSINIRPSG